MSPADPHSPRIVRRETLVRGGRFEFEEVELQTSDDHRFIRQHIRHPGAVCVLPLHNTPSGPAVVMVRVYRAAIGEHVLELPAGTLEKGEEPGACAERELIEETGYRAATLRAIGRFHTSPGLSDEVMWSFLARGLVHVGQRLEEGELLEVEEIPLGAVLDMARSGGLADGKTMLSILLAEDLGMLGEAKR